MNVRKRKTTGNGRAESSPEFETNDDGPEKSGTDKHTGLTQRLLCFLKRPLLLETPLLHSFMPIQMRVANESSEISRLEVELASYMGRSADIVA